MAGSKILIMTIAIVNINHMVPIASYDNFKNMNKSLGSCGSHKTSILNLKSRSEIHCRLDNLIHLQIDEAISYWRNVLKRAAAVVKNVQEVSRLEKKMKSSVIRIT